MTHTTQLPIRNVSCDACEKVIGRILRRYSQAKIESISSDATTLTLSCYAEDLPQIKNRLREYNYLNEEKNNQPHFSYVMKRILGNQPGYEAEHELFTQTMGIFTLLLLVLGGAYFFWFSQMEIFYKLSPILILLPLGIAVNAGALLHVRNVRQHFNCTNGMMTGMIVGMISGFMSGALIGATNGMFMGSLTGMTIGMSASAYAVRKTGIMGVLEGMMAGLMAGTMGAMLSVMMLSDNLILFLYILFGACILILGGMSYFIVKEVGLIQEEKKHVDFIPFALMNTLLFLAVLALILFGPKSSIAWGIVLT